MVTLADAIIREDIESVRQLLRYEDIEQMDEYGFTPLIEAAIVDNIEICRLLLKQGANPNLQDVTGGTALHWAAENNNVDLCQLLFEYHADPNASNLAGQPVLVMPLLRQQAALRKLLVSAGADQVFAQDYINTKLLGHMFELVGTANIVDPKNNFVEVDFEGFILEITLGVIADSLLQFQNHFAARQLRRYSGLAHMIVQVMQRALQLIKYQQYRIDISKYRSKIEELINQEPLIFPVAYEGHAIAFIKNRDVWVKCDRREDSRLYDNIMFYRITRTKDLTLDFYKYLLYEKLDDQFVNQEIDQILGLQPITELKIEAQISGNCSWANMEAVIPALFFLILMQLNTDTNAHAYFKTLALNFFHRWREWNQDRSLHFCIQSYEQGDFLRKACKAEILAAICFQQSGKNDSLAISRTKLILELLLKSPYEYVLKNYLRVYYYESGTEEGKHFFALLKEHGLV